MVDGGDRTARARVATLSPAAASVVLFLVVAGLHALGTTLVYNVNANTAVGVSLFPAAGVTVAALLLLPRRFWAVVLIACFASELVADLVIHENAGTAIGSALSNTAEPLLGAWLTQRLLAGRPLSLERRRPLFAYIVGACAVGPFLGAIVGATAVQLAPHPSPWFGVLGRWFAGDGLGVLVVASLIIAWVIPHGERFNAAQSGEALAVGVAIVGLGLFAFWGRQPALAYAAIPAVAGGALRFGGRGAATGGALLAVIADWATVKGHGLFSVLDGDRPLKALWELQLFLGVVLVTSLVVAAQVIELRAVERELLATAAQSRLRGLLESSPDPIVLIRRDGTIDYTNPAFEALGPPDQGSLAGRPIVDLLPRDRRDEVVEALQAAADAETGTFAHLELPAFRPGDDRIFDITLNLLETDEGRAVLASLRDVTARRRAEDQVREALAQAEAATQAKTEFLATMSHEIRTPMNGVLGMIDILARSSLAPDQRQITTTIAESANALLAVIDDILDFSKIEAGKLTIGAAPFDLGDVLDSAGELLASTASAKAVELVCAVDPGTPRMVVGDPVRIRQVLYNLAGNAVKFTAEGSVTLRAGVEGDAIRLSVTDTGIGISAEQKKTLFEPFVQAEQSTTRRYGGSGLGLAIVARLVRLMNGTVDVESTPGRGSTFSVRLHLPAAPEVPANTLEGIRVTAVTAPDRTPATGVALAALRAAGADVDVVPVGDLGRRDGDSRGRMQGGNPGDVVYVTRRAAEADLDAITRLAESGTTIAMVADRAIDGSTLIGGIGAVATAAVTARSIVRAIEVAAGRHEAEAPASRRPIRAGGPVILVAEDHATNQVVVRRQLTDLGYRCVIASDGAEALEKLDSGDYALLLADCHMPRMDGFELTRTIRARESGTRLPIVAITASALQSEAERCLAVGMDQVLIKPFSLDALDRALSRWLPAPAGSPSPNGHAPTAAAPVDSPVVDLGVLRGIVGDDDEAVAEVLASFRASTAESRQRLDAAITAQDPREIGGVAHRILAGARTVGARALAATCEQIEAADDDDRPALAPVLRAQLEDVIAAIAAAEPARTPD